MSTDNYLYMSEIKSRLKEFIKSMNQGGQKWFEQKTGLSNGFVNNIGKSVRSDSLSKIEHAFPDLNTSWLLKGEGKMLKSDGSSQLEHAPPGRLPKPHRGEKVLFYDVDFAAGDIEFYDDHNQITPAYEMDIPDFNGCTAFRTYGDSMEKMIKSGSIVFGTRIEEWRSHLEYGQIYGIVCTDGRKYMKSIRKAREKEPTHFLLHSENPDYDDFLIPKEKIKSIWLIHGWLNKKV